MFAVSLADGAMNVVDAYTKKMYLWLGIFSF
jgi:hypothetical protein